MNEATVTEKTRISPNTEGMVKTKGGSFHKDDFVGSVLAGLTIEQVKLVATELGIDANKYDHLNVGQQRMNIGNRMRALTSHKDGMKDDVSAKVDAARDTADRMATGFRETNEAAAAAAKAAKGVKPPAPIDGEGNTPD